MKVEGMNSMEMDVLEAALPLRIISAAIGLAPFKGTAAGGLERSLWGLVYTGILLIIHITMLALSFWQRILVFYPQLNIHVITVDITYLISKYVLAILAIVLNGTVNVPQYSLLLRQLNHVDFLLMSNTSYLNQSSRRYLTLQLIIAFVHYGIICVGTYIIPPKETPLSVVISEHFNNLIVCVLALLYVNLVLVIRQRLVLLNQHLKERVCMVSDMNFSGNFSTSAAPFYSQKINNTIRLRTVDINSLRKAYLLLCSSNDIVNSSFGVLILMYVAVDFISALAGLNILMRASFSLFKMVMYIILILMCIERVFILTVSCHITVSQTEVTKRAVNQLLLTEPLGSYVSEELKLFSLQLFTSRMKFSACGLCRMNLGFFFSFSGTLIGYAVIISQIRWSEMSSER